MFQKVFDSVILVNVLLVIRNSMFFTATIQISMAISAQIFIVYALDNVAVVAQLGFLALVCNIRFFTLPSCIIKKTP